MQCMYACIYVCVTEVERRKCLQLPFRLQDFNLFPNLMTYRCWDWCWGDGTTDSKHWLLPSTFQLLCILEAVQFDGICMFCHFHGFWIARASCQHIPFDDACLARICDCFLWRKWELALDRHPANLIKFLHAQWMFPGMIQVSFAEFHEPFARISCPKWARRSSNLATWSFVSW